MLFCVPMLQAQNVFDAADTIVRWNAAAALGSVSNPNPNQPGMQKWVSVASSGISTGFGSWDVSSYKAYYINTGGTQMSFRLKFPKSFTNPDSINKKYPVLMFFHGLGSSGCPSNGGIYNNERQLVYGGQQFKDRVDKGDFDGFVFFPQVNNNSCSFAWGIPYSNYMSVLNKVLDSLVRHVRMDIDRVLVAGVSEGGSAAWGMITDNSKMIAGGMPSAAATGSTNFGAFVHVPIWFATGGKDTRPSPTIAQGVYIDLKNIGGDVKYTLYPDQGHSIWYAHWNEPGFKEFMNEAHKANPLIFFQRNAFCPDSSIQVKLGITPGFTNYEWQRNEATIATYSSGSTTLVDPSVILNYNAAGHEITIKALGSYRVRFKRTASGPWSAWSPRPAVISSKPVTQTPLPQVNGLKSKVLPAPDGSTTVPLILPANYVSYQWLQGTTVVGNQRAYAAAAGDYMAKVVEQFGCGALPSPVFTVVNANGYPKPEPAKNLSAAAVSLTSIQLDWSDNPNAGENETGFEVYRSLTPGGPYQLVTITPPNTITYTNTGLTTHTQYYYIVRAIGASGAAVVSNEAGAKTAVDNTGPTAPSNLQLLGTFTNYANVSWIASTDDVGVGKYDIFINGSKTYTTTQTNFTIANLDSGQVYTVYVKARDAAGNYSSPSNQLVISTRLNVNGLSYNYYEGSWSSLPDFNAIAAVKTGITANIDLAPRNRNDNFGFLWQGYIHVPVTANYIFEVCSDDGSRLFIDQAYGFTRTPTINNDNMHGNTCKSSGSMLLTAGLHPIALAYFEATSGQSVTLNWQNDAGLTKGAVPDSVFKSVEQVAPTMAAPTNLVATGKAYNRMQLTWVDNSSSESGFEIQRSTSAAGVFSQVATVTGNTYTDSGLLANTHYFYQVRAVGATDVSVYIQSSGTTLPMPSAPAAPSALAAQAVSATTVHLTWQDNAGDETGFELLRSATNNSNYRVVATLPAGATGFSDTTLFANVTYYYKVRATGVAGPSAFSNEIPVVTPNSIPSFAYINDFTIRYSTTHTKTVLANDPDGDPLTFTVGPLPQFVYAQNATANSVDIVSVPAIGDQGSYGITVYVEDAFGGKDTIIYNMEVNSNNLPVINPIGNVQMKEGEMRSIALVANDDDDNGTLVWTALEKPSFASFVDSGNGRASLKLAPNLVQGGVYNVTLKVEDGFGGSDTRTFTVSVIEHDPTEKIQVNMKYFTAGGAGWNDVETYNGGVFNVPNLKNTKGLTTTAGITLVSGIYNGTDRGVQGGGVFPNTVMKDGIFWGYWWQPGSTDTLRLRMYGLDASKKYNFVFMGSNNNTGWGTPPAAITTYKIGSETAVIPFYMNANITDTIYQVQPAANGEVLITMIGDAANGVGGVLNALVVDAQYDDGTLPVKPTNLAAEPIAGTGVKLTWTDQAYNEYYYKVYRAATRPGPYTLLGTLEAGTTAYTDPSVSPFTQYHYYVVGANNYGAGDPSDTVAVTSANNKPVIAGLVSSLAVKTDANEQDDFTVTDTPGDVVTVTLVNNPSYVSLQSLGGNNYRLVAVPTASDLGTTAFTVKAADDKGGEVTAVVTISVSDQNTRSVYLNFGNYGDNAPAPWNNYTGYGNAGTTLNNLKDEHNATTPFGFQLVGGWQGISILGHQTGNNTGVFSDVVLKSGLWDNKTEARQVRFTGLDDSKMYNVVIVGSQNEGLDASARYAAGSTSDTLNARYNTNQTGNLNNLTPVSGVINIDMTKLASATYQFLTAIQLEEFTPGINLNPVNLYVEPRDRHSAMLSWSDRCSNEDAVDGFQLQQATSADFSGAVSIDLPANTTTYTGTGLTPNTRYWYRVRAKVGGVFTGWSNVGKTITPASITYVNFNIATEYNAASPWFNLEALPDQPFVFSNLPNQANQPTGMTLSIEKTMNGDNNFGVITGNNSGIAPDVVLQSNYWIDNTQLAQMKLTGLNQAKRYRIGFLGSMSTNGWTAGNYTCTYTINGRTVYLNSWMNSSKIVYIGDVQADSNGELLLDFSTTQEAAYGFNAGLVIQSYDDVPGGGTILNRSRNNPAILAATAGMETARTTTSAVTGGRVYPNPFIDQINLDFNNTAADNHVSVDVYDLSGKLVFRKAFGKLAAGYHTLRVATGNANLPTGIYLVTLNVNGKPVQVNKMIKANQ
jgi:fibronectin type 3 domain-containing protein/poly(3-hydroxybutyrate) depolymerase